MSRLGAWVAGVGLLVGCGASSPVPDGAATAEAAWDANLLFPGNIPEDADGNPTHWVFRVLAAGTGAPIAGARVGAVAEAEHPLPGVSTPLRTETSDADGWVRLRIDDIREPAAWLYVGAEGREPRAEFRFSGEGTIWLRPACDIPVVLRDPLDRPVAGALLDTLLGCGHTPSVRLDRTDADGRATVPRVEGQLWLVHAGLVTDYLHLGDWGWEPGDPPVVLRPDPAADVEGIVVEADGRRAAGLWVGCRQHRHRGPWTRTDAQGRFLLTGVPPGEWLWVEREERPEPAAAVFEPPPAGVVRWIRLPAPGAEQAEDPDDPAPADPAADVTVAPVDEAGSPVTGVTVLAVRESDAWTQRVRLPDPGPGAAPDAVWPATLRLPPGRYAVRVETGLGPFAPAQIDLEVAAGETREVRVPLARRPTVAVSLTGAPPDVRVTLATEAAERDVTAAILDGAPVPVPEVASVLRVRAHGRTLTLSVLLARAAEPLTIDCGRAPRLRVRIAGPDGAPVPGRVEVRGPGVSSPRSGLEPEVATPDIALDLPCEGPATVIVHPISARLASVQHRVVIPGGDAVLDLGEVRCPTRASRTLRVLARDGAPAAGYGLGWMVHGASRSWSLSGTNACVADADGPPTGELLRIDREGFLPLLVTLTHEGPWTLRWPAGTVRVTAADADGAPRTEFTALLDGEERWTDSGFAEFAGVAAGPHVLVVTVPGRLARIHRLVLADGEARHIRAILQPR